MPPSPSNAYISVLLGTQEVRSSVRSVEVEDCDRAIDQATIVLEDPREVSASAFREGVVVKVSMGWSDALPVLFEGVVRRNAVDSQAHGVQRVTITAFDLSYRLQGPAKTAEYTGTLSGILQRILMAGSYGIVPGQIVPDPDRTYPDNGPLRQVNRRDWDFIQDLASLNNGRAFVEHNEGASKFYFVPVSRLMNQNLGTLQYNCGLSRLREFRYQRTASAASPQRQTDSTDPQTGDPIQQRPAPSLPEPPPTPDPEVVQRLAQRGGSETYVAAHLASVGTQPEQQRPQGRAAGLPDSSERAEQAARQDPTRRLGFLGEGVAVGNTELRAKGMVTIEGIPTWAAGDWYLCQVNHRYERVIEQGQVQAGRETHARASYTSRIRVTR